MIQTHWQSTYSPVIKTKVKPSKVKTEPKVRGAIFTDIEDSVIARRIISVLKDTPSVNAMEMRKLACTVSAHQYLKLLEGYGHVTSELIRSPKTGMLVKHFSLKENYV